MATSKKPWTKQKLSEHMLKRLAQLSAGQVPNYGTAMAALDARGLVNGYQTTGKVTLTDAGRAALAEARAEGW